MTCEELVDVAETSAASGDRLAHASILVLQAACEPRPGPPVDPVRLAWGDAYRLVVTGLLPACEELRLSPRLLPGSTSEWVKLSIGGMAAVADGPWHWIPKGIVCAYVTEEPDASALPEGAAARRSGKGWIVEVAVPPVSFDRSASDQEGELAEAMLACLSLRNWSRGLDR